jgi:hypothetical protein
MITAISPLLHVKEVIDRLKAIETTTLTETEREAVQDSLQQAYERAAFLLETEQQQTAALISWYYLCRACRRMIPVSFDEYVSHYHGQRGESEQRGIATRLARCFACEITVVMELERSHSPQTRPCSPGTEGTAKPIIDNFFALQIFRTQSLSYAAPKSRHPNQFSSRYAKNWFRTRLDLGPAAYDIRLVPKI